MTYYVSSGMLNPTHSLTHLQSPDIVHFIIYANSVAIFTPTFLMEYTLLHNI